MAASLSCAVLNERMGAVTCSQSGIHFKVYCQCARVPTLSRGRTAQPLRLARSLGVGLGVPGYPHAQRRSPSDTGARLGLPSPIGYPGSSDLSLAQARDRQLERTPSFQYHGSLVYLTFIRYLRSPSSSGGSH
eukprot:1032097-Rhodomonas_salina.9